MALNTPFFEIHKELDAKMVPCGKWNLPLFYPGGSVAEHRHTRSETSLFDLTGSRCFQLTGKSCGKNLDKLLLYSCSSLPVGGMMENILLDENGRFTALFTLCRMQEEDFMLLLDRNTPEPAAAEVLSILKGFSPRELTENMAQFAVIGKTAMEVLTAAGAAELPGIGQWKMLTLQDDEAEEFRVIAIRHDRFGETGYDLCCNAALAVEIYGAVYRISGTAPAGIGAWESLRIESRTPAPATELTEEIFPVDAGWKIPADRPLTFRGGDALASASGKFHVGVIKLERHPAAPGSPVLSVDGTPVGKVTSGCFCPSASAALVMVQVDSSIKDGAELFCQVNGKAVSGLINFDLS